MQNAHITIIGGGLSGMLTSLACAHFGISVILVERNNPENISFFSDPRTTAITDSSKVFLDEIKVWESLKPFTRVIRDIYVVRNKSNNMLHFTQDEQKESPTNKAMGYMIANHDMLLALYELVQKNEYITTYYQHDYEVIHNSAEFAKIRLLGGEEEIEIFCSLLIACDGKESKIKRKYFTDKIVKSYNQKAITFHVSHTKPHEGTAVEHFLPSGPFAILPLKNPNHSSVVWCLQGKLANVIPKLSENDFLELVQENFGLFLGKIEILGDIWPPKFYPLQAKITNNYYNGSIALVADSAHVIHPLAGQGLNQGVKDISCLTDLICRNHRKLFSYFVSQDSLPNSYSLSETANDKKKMLEEYEKARKGDNTNMFVITDQINEIFTNNSIIRHKILDIGFELFEKIKPLKSLFIKYAMGKRS